MDTISAVVPFIGTLALAVTWVASIVLSSADGSTGPRTTTVASRDAVTDLREVGGAPDYAQVG